MTDTDDPHITAVAKATARYERARKDLEDTVLAALRAPDAKPTKIADASPWTAAHVRKLAREKGIQAAPSYQKRAEAIRKRAAEAGSSPPTENHAPRVQTPQTAPESPSTGLPPSVAALPYEEAKRLAKEAEAAHPNWGIAARRRHGRRPEAQRWHAMVADAVQAGHLDLTAPESAAD